MRLAHVDAEHVLGRGPRPRQLLCAHAVATERGEQLENVGAASAVAPLHAFADRGVVGQEVVEVVAHGFAVNAQGGRDGRRERQRPASRRPHPVGVAGERVRAAVLGPPANARRTIGSCLASCPTCARSDQVWAFCRTWATAMARKAKRPLRGGRCFRGGLPRVFFGCGGSLGHFLCSDLHPDHPCRPSKAAVSVTPGRESANVE